MVGGWAECNNDTYRFDTYVGGGGCCSYCSSNTEILETLSIVCDTRLLIYKIFNIYQIHY